MVVLYPNLWYYITRNVIKGLHCTCMTNYTTVQITQSLTRTVLEVYMYYIVSDSFTILGLWVLGLAVSHINESQL